MDHDRDTEMGKPKDRSRADEDACSKLWSVYLREAEKYDGELVRGWKHDMEGLLIFSSLYSASLTAFIIESYQTLQEDQLQTSASLLAQISQQLAAASNGTTVTLEPPTLFQPPTSAVVCNIFWFLALALALTCSLLATFVQQWIRDFIHGTNLRPSPVLRARILMASYFGMRRFGMHAIVDLIPFLLHLSLILFFAGLVAFLIPVNRILQLLMSCVLAILVIVYLFFTLLPIISFDAPFRTPISSILLPWRNITRRWLRRFNSLLSREGRTQPSTREQSYDTVVWEQSQRALAFTLKSLTDDFEFLPLIEAIPEAIYDSTRVRYANISLIVPFFISDTPTLNIISHIAAFGQNPSVWLDEKRKVRCLTAYSRAVWTLAYVFVSTASTSGEWFDHGIRRRTIVDMTRVWFPRSIEYKLDSFDFPKHYAASALALLRFSQLRSLQAGVSSIKDALQESQGRREAFWTPKTHSLRRQLKARITEVSYSWAFGVYEAFRVNFLPALDLLVSARDDAEHSRRLEDIIPSSLDVDLEQWIVAQITILGHFLANSVDSGLEKPHMMSETYNFLSETITHELKTIQFSVNDNFRLIDSLCAPIRRFADVTQRDPFFDTLFVYSLRHFTWDRDWACKSQFHEAVECRKLIQDYFVNKSFNAVTLCEADESLYLEDCILADFGSEYGDPTKYLPATWLLFYCLTKSPYAAHNDFAKKVSMAIRNATNSSVLAQHELFALTKIFADAVVCSLLVYTPWQRIHDLDGLLNWVKRIGRELLPERKEFDDFSLAPIALNSIPDFLIYVSSLQLILIANFITACQEPVVEVHPFRLEAFKKICELPDPSHFVDLSKIDKKTQIRFAEGVLELLSSCRNGNGGAVGAASNENATLQSRMFETILESCDDEFAWITSAGAAATLLEGLERHRDGCCSYDSQKCQGRIDSLRARCQKVVELRK
ncbi:hypothetical protein D9758_005778 [Tetrapyrgos nigripes]|uniref:DUF6535 domain-containing protein n=1 Tax=Tetrapyrgos nigripes TaxID=182062 RepID=A0A8H5GJL1_9AGAR|nr:hypothetical protein D9758_005778 [Tetrapyrgos nigripes]